MTQIALRAVDVERDLALVHGWMQEPHVAAWWELAGPVERVRDHLRTQMRTGVELWIATEDARPFAYVETYVVAQDPLAGQYDAEPGDRGFHLLVGPPELLGSGAARRLVRHLVSPLLGQSGVTRVVCEPDVRNARMLAFCRSLGGERLAELDLDGRRAALIAWRRRDEVAAA